MLNRIYRGTRPKPERTYVAAATSMLSNVDQRDPIDVGGGKQQFGSAGEEEIQRDGGGLNCGGKGEFDSNRDQGGAC